ncbi:MAG TPA: NAD(P)-dependent oxidoreductase [Sedimentisphaerales bacterium]|jgi:3-hydroxyisobutyrate dehydrogenase|nr:NAD(P)-dependent oxidoreductase [Sedimentisphaerales bacterium]HNU31724.1 NAD(P)-dependent oxidoreductase [Sedimentisphaerales bacterium]
MTMPRIGFIGIGIMGEPMTRNLLRAGYPLTIHTRTRSKAETLLNEGARWADTPRDAAHASDIVITCVTDTPDVRAVLLGPGGVIEAAREGLTCIDMSTISPAETRTMGEVLARRGVTLIDAPVSGGQIGAIEAKLSIMAGGSAEAVERVRPILETLGRTVTHCGPLGFGQTTKLANQVMVIHTIMSVAEGLAFAERAGLDLETTLKVTTAGAAGSHSLKVLGPKVAAGDLKPAFMVDLQQKDLRLVLEYAEQIGQPLPGTALVKQLFAVLQAEGRGRDGTHALIDVLRQLAGRKT